MATAAATARVGTMAEVAAGLDDIPLDRIVWDPRPGSATEADLLNYATATDRLAELLDGTLVEKPMGHRQGLFAMTVAAILMNFVKPRRLGVVNGPDGLVRLAPGRTRMPDVSFTAWASLPTDDAHLQPVAEFAPDLAVEVLSPDNTRAEMARKRAEYFAAGTRLVWVVDTVAATVSVYSPAGGPEILTAADTLRGDPVLPGFSLPLTDLFDDPQLNPRPH